MKVVKKNAGLTFGFQQFLDILSSGKQQRTKQNSAITLSVLYACISSEDLLETIQRGLVQFFVAEMKDRRKIQLK